ncbi:5-formyltetrahydrofolate cyclo-ligase family [Musa troglodytarum]|uniref:5-formyltetrahydrofolate cyclo-ligase n=1 Tax=Musa troglodytarum TaxID=320322 RepID=A0A9E7FIC2_9LILI|nr:5-formyltetrahydrofolate cyclo-ligase family [Musa troglodytarum]
MSGDRGGVLSKAAFFLMTHCHHHHHPTLRAFLPSIAVPVRCAAGSATPPAAIVMSDTAALQQKRAVRSRIRKALKDFSPAQRAQEDVEIQNFVLNSSWFKSCKGLCAYISCKSLREVDTSTIIADVLKNSEHDLQVMKKLYVPRVEDKNSHMRMLRISTIEDLVANSMNILEPYPVDSDQNEREDVLLASQPVDLLLLPGLAFDRHGRRLGRGGGYYDVFLRKYEELANQQNWKQPLRVALAYSVQIVEDELIPMTETDVPVDALVSSNGVFPISPAAFERM